MMTHQFRYGILTPILKSLGRIFQMLLTLFMILSIAVILHRMKAFIKVPLLVMYILMGMLLGPFLLDVLSQDFIDLGMYTWANPNNHSNNDLWALKLEWVITQKKVFQTDCCNSKIISSNINVIPYNNKFSEWIFNI